MVWYSILHYMGRRCPSLDPRDDAARDTAGGRARHRQIIVIRNSNNHSNHTLHNRNTKNNRAHHINNNNRINDDSKSERASERCSMRATRGAWTRLSFLSRKPLAMTPLSYIKVAAPVVDYIIQGIPYSLGATWIPKFPQWAPGMGHGQDSRLPKTGRQEISLWRRHAVRDASRQRQAVSDSPSLRSPFLTLHTQHSILYHTTI